MVAESSEVKAVCRFGARLLDSERYRDLLGEVPLPGQCDVGTLWFHLICLEG